jgi:hypothetical protein
MAIIPGQATHVATCTTLFFRCLCILITASHRPLTCNDADCLPTHPCRQIQQPDTVIPGLDRNQSQQEDSACPSSRIRIRSQSPKPCHHDWRPITKRLKSDDGAGTSSLAPPNSLDLVEWDWTVDAQLAAHPLVRAPALFPSPACRVPTVQNPMPRCVWLVHLGGVGGGNEWGPRGRSDRMVWRRSSEHCQKFLLFFFLKHSRTVSPPLIRRRPGHPVAS